MAEFLFFTMEQSKRPLQLLNAKCENCGFYKNCRTPKMKVDGKGERKILIISDRPGREEDQHGRPWMGNTGKYAEEKFRKVGINVRRDCWLTNATICYNEKPSDKKMKQSVMDCRPNVIKTIKELNPEKILLFGGHAVKSVIGHYWKEDTGSISRWTGWQIPCQELNAWICPSVNPAFILRERERNQGQVTEMEFQEQLQEVSKLEGRPWNPVPNWEKEIKLIYNVDEAAARIRKYKSGLVAFDYETTCLKPEKSTSEIVCCSVSFGNETIAFPWYGVAIDAMKEMLQNADIGKIAHNLQFEDIWTTVKLGIKTRGWAWDTMVNAHLLDPRKSVTGLKFQSFVELGIGDYNSVIEPYLEGREKGCYSLNRVRDIGLRKLLLYCGWDSLLEYKLAMKQAKKIGIEL